MNRATFTGIVRQIGDFTTFSKSGKEYSYRTILLSICDPDTLDETNTEMAVNDWHTHDIPDAGTMVDFTISISSGLNKAGLYYHKLNLFDIIKI